MPEVSSLSVAADTYNQAGLCCSQVLVCVFVLQTAQKFYVEAGCTREAVDMYNQAGMWEQAHKVGL